MKLSLNDIRKVVFGVALAAVLAIPAAQMLAPRFEANAPVPASRVLLADGSETHGLTPPPVQV